MPFRPLRFAIVSLASAALLVSCAPQPASTADSDPFEGFNRGVYAFNDVVDQFILRPVTSVYRAATPEMVRSGVHNFLTNLTAPVVLVNNVLQGDPTQAFSTFWRFVINTTVGIGGVYDVAGGYTELKYRQEDFGQTLGIWGSGPGPYIVLPLLGPSSGRDAAGKLVDVVTDPLTWYLSDGWTAARYGAEAIDGRNDVFEALDEINRTSLDPYATIRSAYMQKREAQIKNRQGADDKKVP